MSGPTMKCRKQDHPALLAAFCLLLLAATPAHALKSDRQQPLDVRADSTDGTLGDGTATLRGNVEIRQGTLLIRADVAAVEKAEGRVRRFELTGNPVHLQQEIEEEGLVSARARKVEYEVASGIVILTGAADVDHPQYQINGEVLRYDMNAQHFQGSGGDGDGRIRIQLDPEVVPGEAPAAAAPAAETRDPPADADSG
ncbi:MAG: lipopolysaccharide transport periplasmic protein LptA [Lysobacterales bacterium]|nr:MAG: lipopolysaccharide transport periplasmic protein LptA [Xanthomonadales bacterium]